MRLFCRTLGCCCAAVIGLAAIAAPAQQPDFPYTAYVSIGAAYVRSGPGKHYYPADKLVRGDAVEVYREDPGGWLAIRPPRGSFSWVPASQLQPTKHNLAIVIGDRVASHVGSKLDESHDVVQVRLERGEAVEIVAAEPLTVDGQQELWCKISPPSGEFRWIYGKFVDRNQPPPDSVARSLLHALAIRRLIRAHHRRTPSRRRLLGRFEQRCEHPAFRFESDGRRSGPIGDGRATDVDVAIR